MVCAGEFPGSDGRCATDHTDEGKLVLKVAAAFRFRKAYHHQLGSSGVAVVSINKNELKNCMAERGELYY